MVDHHGNRQPWNDYINNGLILQPLEWTKGYQPSPATLGFYPCNSHCWFETLNPWTWPWKPSTQTTTPTIYYQPHQPLGGSRGPRKPRHSKASITPCVAASAAVFSCAAEWWTLQGWRAHCPWVKPTNNHWFIEIHWWLPRSMVDKYFFTAKND